jgi:Lrp/AsnC family leucine-responsive transcriptional regulator
MDSDKLLDDLNWRILTELQQNARISYTELGRRLGLTSPAVAERVRRLEEAGIITGYHAHLDLAKLNLPISALVRVKDRTRGSSTGLARQLPEVLEAFRVTGEDYLVMRVAVRSVERLQSLIDRLAHSGETETSLILSTPVEHRVIRQPDGSAAAAPAFDE